MLKSFDHNDMTFELAVSDSGIAGHIRIITDEFRLSLFHTIPIREFDLLNYAVKYNLTPFLVSASGIPIPSECRHETLTLTKKYNVKVIG